MLLHEALTKVCKDDLNMSLCPRLVNAGCSAHERSELSWRWNIQFLVGNATTVVPQETDACRQKAWRALRFALPDNNEQAAALLSLARAKPPVLVAKMSGDNNEFVEDLASSLRRLDPTIRECALSPSSKCPEPTGGSVIALSGANTAPRMLELLGPTNAPVFASDTWTPNAIFRKGREEGVRTLCVTSVRHNSALKEFVKGERERDNKMLDVLPRRWRGLEMVRYTLGWDLYASYAARLRGSNTLNGSWVLEKTTQRDLQIRLDDPNARPFWDPPPRFVARCCSLRTNGTGHDCEEKAP
jgi:hypothetical protein